MKKCPQCSRTYADETLIYCLDDRALLQALSDLETIKIPSLSSNPPSKIRLRNILALSIIAATFSLLAWFVWLKCQNPPYEVKQYRQVPWNDLINNANKRVWAVGTKLSPFERSQVSSLINKIQKQQIPEGVKLVLMNPDSNQLVKRIDDELKERIKDEQLRKEKISDVQNEIRSKLSWIDDYVSELKGNETDKISVKCSEVYPTIGVVIIDDDLYAYSYPFGDTAEDSAVIIFRKYANNPETKDLATFFENHLKSIVRDAGARVNGKCEGKPILISN